MTLIPLLALLQAAATMSMSPALSWDSTQQGMVLSYRRFGTIYRTHLQNSSSVA